MSYDVHIQSYNKFGLIPVWHQEKRDFESLCRAILDQCKKRLCELHCNHNIASMDALVDNLGKNRFGLIPLWRQDSDQAPEQWEAIDFTGKSLPYAPAYPEEPRPQPPQTPLWPSGHIYPGDPAWNPADQAEDHDWAIYARKGSDQYRMFHNLYISDLLMVRSYLDVLEGWLDETLRSLNNAIFLQMASGLRRYSRDTEGVFARLTPTSERGNLIDVTLLWDRLPSSLHNLPIRHVLPRHPTAAHSKDPVLFISGPRKGQFGIVHESSGDLEEGRIMVSEVKKGGRRRKVPEPTEHSMYELTLCQWPKK